MPSKTYFESSLRSEILKMTSQKEIAKTAARVKALESNPVVQLDAKIFSCFNPKTDFLKTHFSASHDFVDFTDCQKAADEINSWVSKSTKHVINKIVDASELDIPLMKMILVSAIFFKREF